MIQNERNLLEKIHAYKLMTASDGRHSNLQGVCAIVVHSLYT